MITKFKIFEGIENGYMLGKDQFFINDVMEYLVVDTFVMDQSIPETPYKINVMDFFKEILLNKKIIFQSENKIQNYPIIKGKVTAVGYFSYKNEFFIKVKLKKPKFKYEDNWYNCKHEVDKEYLMKNNSMITIYDYDADNKPLHKLVELKKRAEKYNI